MKAFFSSASTMKSGAFWYSLCICWAFIKTRLKQSANEHFYVVHAIHLRSCDCFQSQSKPHSNEIEHSKMCTKLSIYICLLLPIDIPFNGYSCQTKYSSACAATENEWQRDQNKLHVHRKRSTRIFRPFCDHFGRSTNSIWTLHIMCHLKLINNSINATICNEEESVHAWIMC